MTLDQQCPKYLINDEVEPSSCLLTDFVGLFIHRVVVSEHGQGVCG